MTKRAYIRALLVYSFYLLLFFAIQSTWPTTSLAQTVKPNFLLVFAVISAYQFGYKDAIVIGMIAGFLLDYMAGRLIGIGMLILLFTALIAAELFRRNLTRSILPAIMTTVICTSIYELSTRVVLWLVLWLDNAHVTQVSFLLQAASVTRAILMNLAILIPIFVLVRYFGPYKRSIGYGHVDRKGDDIRW